MRVAKSIDKCADKVRAVEFVELNQYLAGFESGDFERLKDVFLAAFAITEYEGLREAHPCQLFGCAQPALNDFIADAINSRQLGKLSPVRFLYGFKGDNCCICDL